MDYRLTGRQLALKKEFEDFFKEEMKNAPPEYHRKAALEAMYGTDEGWHFHRNMQKKLAEKGWLAMAWPKEYGGRDAQVIEQLIFELTRAYYRAPGVDLLSVRLFAPTLLLYGTEEQKKRLLPAIARGEVTYCQGWSEPNAGSDLAALKTTAIKEGDHYIINGQKTWTTGAHRTDHMFLLARTDPSRRRSAGLSVFNIKMDLPGIEVRPIYYMNGDHVYNEVYFTEVKIPEHERIGPENEGWKLTRATMNFERANIRNFGEARRGLEDVLNYVKTTRRNGKFLSENPIVRQKLAKLFIDIDVGYALIFKVAWLQEKGNLLFSASTASEAKVYGSELLQRMANSATEIMGLYGQLEFSKWAPLGGVMTDLYQSGKGTTIASGSSEIQRNIIAWVGMDLPRIK